MFDRRTTPWKALRLQMSRFKQASARGGTSLTSPNF